MDGRVSFRNRLLKASRKGIGFRKRLLKGRLEFGVGFRTDPDRRKVSARYETRNGDIYTLKPRQDGGVTVEVGGRQQVN